MSVGRKREFEEQEAIEAAMRTFWLKGYTGTSLSDLTSSMGINKPSLYSAFGNKEQLFVRATEHYVQQYATQHLDLLRDEKKSFKQRLSDYLLSVISMQCDKSLPDGCFISLCASETVAECMPEEATTTIRDAQIAHEKFLTEFLKDEQAKGNLDSDADILALALYMMTFTHGAASMARSGKSFEEIKLIVEPAVTVIEG